MNTYRMPAEWEPQTAVWFAWPANKSWWPGKYETVSIRFAAMIGRISNWTPVKLICNANAQNDAMEKLASIGAMINNITFIDYQTNDVWCRDFGPIFVKDKNDRLAITNWQFNAWGGKFPGWDLDNAIPEKIANKLHIPIISPDIILEGGAIDVNGEGLMLTTDDVLLNDNRNKAITRETYEELFSQHLGISQVIWLNKGLHNDDTDGHIDNLARFTNSNTVVIASESNQDSPNFLTLKENREILDQTVLKNGGKLNIVELPLPEPVMFEGEMLPASYLNFLITNDLVIVPSYNQPADQEAVKILKKLFPGKHVESFDCCDFLQEGGAIHCLSQQQPA